MLWHFLVDFAAPCRLDYATSLVAESESNCPPSIGGECALGTDVLEDSQEDFECLAAATAMVAEMAFWKSTGTYVDALPPSRANIVDGMRIFRRHYELQSLDFSTAFLQGSLHEEIWLRRPPGFTGSFPASTQWSLRRPVYGLRQAPGEWHDTLRKTPAALGFAPSTSNPSLFLRTDTSLPPFYVLVYITRDIARRTITLTQSHMVHQVLQRFGFRYSSPQSTPLPTGHTLLAPPLDESRSSQSYTFSRGSGSVLWRSTRLYSVLSSSCEAEVYTGAMAAQELCWFTYLLTDLGEAPRSPPVLYVDNKAMLSLCQEH
ncbi:unnamed protein product [Closterium sp. NIES-53]